MTTAPPTTHLRTRAASGGRRRRLVALGLATGLVAGLVSGLTLATSSVASATIVSTSTASDLAGAMAAPGTTVTGASLAVSYPCDATECPTAASDTPLAGFPDNGGSYTIMSTGNALDADHPNDSGSLQTDWGVNNATGIGSTVYDDQILRVDLGPATGNCLAFDFRFLSEEYPEFVNSGFNDAFVAQLDTWSVAADPNTQSLTAPGNFAAGAGDQISVDGAGPSSMGDTTQSGVGTTYDGATSLLTARAPVTPGTSHTLYLTLFDQGDPIYDSAVFLDNLRFENAKSGQCKSLSLDPYDGGTGMSQTAGTKVKVAKNKSSISVPLDCNLPTGPVNCTVNGTASFKASNAGRAARGSSSVGRAAARAAAKSKLVATGSITLAPDASGVLTMQTSKAGKKALKAAAEKPKTLRKQAKKLLKQARHTRGAKAAKLRTKAARLTKQAKKLAKKPLGTITVTLVNPANGASSSFVVKPKR